MKIISIEKRETDSHGMHRWLGRGCKPVSLFAFSLVAIVFFFAPMQVMAQAVGAIVGIVTDPTGAVIPGAKVTATRVETGVSQFTTTSGGDGSR